MPGDVDRNGIVDLNDSDAISNYFITDDVNSAFKVVDAFTLILAELDYNGIIDTNDADIAANMFVGNIETN